MEFGARPEDRPDGVEVRALGQELGMEEGFFRPGHQGDEIGTVGSGFQ